MIKVWVDGWFKKNLGDDLFLDILAKRYPKIKFYYYSNLDYTFINKENKNLKQIKKYSLINIIRYSLNKIYKIFNISKAYKISDFVKTDYSILISGSYFMEPSKKEDIYNDKDKYINKEQFPEIYDKGIYRKENTEVNYVRSN